MPSLTETPQKKRSAGRNLPAAIASAVVLFAWILGSLLFWEPGFVIFLAVAAPVGAFEIVRAIGYTGAHARLWPIVIGSSITVIASHLATQYFGHVGGVSVILAGLAVMMAICLGLRLRGPIEGYIRDVAASGITIVYIPGMLAPLILLLNQPDGNLRVVLYFLLVPCYDIGAYAIGSLIGKHKMVPRISPGKSWEGFIGGLLLAAVVGALVAPAMLKQSWWAGAIVGLVLAVGAAIGDLVASMIKRDAGIKDMGTIIPGHGGAMDRLDSLLMAAPFAWMSMLVLFP